MTGTDTFVCVPEPEFETVTKEVTSVPAGADSLGVVVTASPS